MKKEVSILLAVHDEGDAALIHKNLRMAGIYNPITRFSDGSELLDFLLENRIGKIENKIEMNGTGGTRDSKSYLLLLDLSMPRVGGVEAIRRLKADEALKKMSVIVMTDSGDDPGEIEKCRLLGCGNFISKPVGYEKFVEAIKKLGLFLVIVEIPSFEPEPGTFDGEKPGKEEME